MRQDQALYYIVGFDLASALALQMSILAGKP
jgi:hypothetical protein